MARYLRAPAAILAVLLTLPVACDVGPETPVVTRDSAGVALTLSNLPAWTPETAWRLTDGPELVVGGLAGQRPYEFTSAGDARILPNGNLLVTHCSDPPELRLFGPDGSFRQTLGGPGSAAGECNFILHSWMADDAVLLYDPSLARITYFHFDGSPPRVVDLDAAGLGDVERGDPVWVSLFSDGTLLGRPNQSGPAENGRSRAPFPYHRLNPETMALDTVVVARGTAYEVEGLGTEEEDIRTVLFSPFTHAIAHGDVVYLADSEDFAIDVRATDGTLIRRFSRAWEPVEIEGSFRRRYRDQRVAAAPTGYAEATRREMARAVFAENFPAHDGELLVDPGANLWIAHLLTPGETTRVWSVFNHDGRWLGEIAVPPALRITDVGDDYVLGVWRDGEGVQTVRRFGLVKPGM